VLKHGTDWDNANFLAEYRQFVGQCIAGCHSVTTLAFIGDDLDRGRNVGGWDSPLILIRIPIHLHGEAIVFAENCCVEGDVTDDKLILAGSEVCRDIIAESCHGGGIDLVAQNLERGITCLDGAFDRRPVYFDRPPLRRKDHKRVRGREATRAKGGGFHSLFIVHCLWIGRVDKVALVEGPPLDRHLAAYRVFRGEIIIQHEVNVAPICSLKRCGAKVQGNCEISVFTVFILIDNPMIILYCVSINAVGLL